MDQVCISSSIILILTHAWTLEVEPMACRLNADVMPGQCTEKPRAEEHSTFRPS